ncbi:MAG TPA: chromosomal replication initiator protein DnaA [Saprospiraceae bacterium]|nr:chromosomal replication initiator protein DnaA [Saprospiraceae bacterium]HMP14743.1 chromosomal replication initiator protein DnaA [Saprospiraceae bacterium]
MMRDHATVWENCLQMIRNRVNLQSYKTWFEPIRPVRLENNALTIQVPSIIFYEWLEEHFVDVLKTTIRKELGEKGKLEYQILNGSAAREAIRARGIHSNGTAEMYAPDVIDTKTIQNPFVIPGIRKNRINPQLNPNHTFDNYIEGDCNKLARSAGFAIAKKPGGTPFNPLFIYGDTGLGKTHLAHAIGNEVLKLFPDKSCLYVTADHFTNQFIQTLKNNAVNDFINFYQQIDVLIVDDIQFLSNKQKTQDIFFQIFNQLHQGGKQIVLTSDRPPKDLNGIEERLISRFKWGLSADLQSPDLETRMAIMEVKMSRENIDIPPNVVEYICFNIQNNIRELEGVLVALVAQSSLNDRKIDIDLAKEVIKNFVTQINKEITLGFIQRLVAEHFNVPVEKLQAKTRKRSIVIARQLSMYLAKNLTDKSLKAIGEMFGGRDHSTVIYSCKTVQDLMETDAVFKDTVAELEKKIKMSLNEK